MPSPTMTSPSHDAGTNDDILRTYLNEVGNHPLLTPEAERTLTRELTAVRLSMTRTLLHRDYIQRCALRWLKQINNGSVRLDRISGMAVSDHDTKQRLRKRLAGDIQTVQTMLAENAADFTRLSRPVAGKANGRRGAIRRRLTDRGGRVARILNSYDFRIDLLIQLAARLNRLVSTEDEVLSAAAADRRARVVETRLHEHVGDLAREMKRFNTLQRRFQVLAGHLVSSNLRLVISFARQYRSEEIPLLDLIQEGNSGLVKAANRFDCRRKCRFSTYAVWWIREAVQRATYRQSGTIRVPRDRRRLLMSVERQRESMRLGKTCRLTEDEMAQQTGVPARELSILRRALQPTLSLHHQVDDEPFSDCIEDKAALDPVQVANQTMLRQRLSFALGLTLTAEQRQVIKLRFGLDECRPHTLEEIGRLLCVSRETIRKIEKRAVQKLREPECARYLRGFIEEADTERN